MRFVAKIKEHALILVQENTAVSARRDSREKTATKVGYESFKQLYFYSISSEGPSSNNCIAEVI